MSSDRVAVPKGATIAPIMVKGDNYLFHVERHKEKITKHPGDCGIDLFPADILRIETIEPEKKSLFMKGGWHIIYVSTKVSMTICGGAYLFVTPRSSTAKTVPSAEALSGIIDAGYTGELLIRFKTHEMFLEETRGHLTKAIEGKVALAQAIPQMFCYPQFVVGESSIILPPEVGGRGSNGFGSTNK